MKIIVNGDQLKGGITGLLPPNGVGKNLAYSGVEVDLKIEAMTLNALHKHVQSLCRVSIVSYQFCIDL
jgi:hypothetical protein